MEKAAQTVPDLKRDDAGALTRVEIATPRVKFPKN
jgi:hypothetical protein